MQQGDVAVIGPRADPDQQPPQAPPAGQDPPQVGQQPPQAPPAEQPVPQSATAVPEVRQQPAAPEVRQQPAAPEVRQQPAAPEVRQQVVFQIDQQVLQALVQNIGANNHAGLVEALERQNAVAERSLQMTTEPWMQAVEDNKNNESMITPEMVDKYFTDGSNLDKMSPELVMITSMAYLGQPDLVKRLGYQGSHKTMEDLVTWHNLKMLEVAAPAARRAYGARVCQAAAPIFPLEPRFHEINERILGLSACGGGGVTGSFGSAPITLHEEGPSGGGYLPVTMQGEEPTVDITTIEDAFNFLSDRLDELAKTSEERADVMGKVLRRIQQAAYQQKRPQRYGR